MNMMSSCVGMLVCRCVAVPLLFDSPDSRQHILSQRDGGRGEKKEKVSYSPYSSPLTPLLAAASTLLFVLVVVNEGVAKSAPPLICGRHAPKPARGV